MFIVKDSQILAIYKLPGVLSQCEAEQEGQDTNTDTDTIIDLAGKYLDSDDVGLVHRLDRPVSGLMVLGKTASATKRLSGMECFYTILVIQYHRYSALLSVIIILMYRYV